jgi:hypothetical protein
MDETRKKNLTDIKTWMRLVYMILFVVAFNVAEIVLGAVVLAQFLFQLFTGRPNERLRTLGQGLGAYIYEIIVFLSYHSDDKPFPFGHWPEGVPAPKSAASTPAAKPARRGRKPKAAAAAKTAKPAASE